MPPGVLERQYLRARNGLAYATGETRPPVAQTPRDLIWKRDKARMWRAIARTVRAMGRPC